MSREDPKLVEIFLLIKMQIHFVSEIFQSLDMKLICISPKSNKENL